ncbi:MAG: phosphoglucomutase [Veillonella caviae]|nr:phosphoglucomutase [Veillonella caviae]
MISELAGKKVRPEDCIHVATLTEAYYNLVPRPEVKGERISFGTSGHRGKSLERSFNELHVAAITQAICDGRKEFGATGVCFVGHDTHALSTPALHTVLEVLAGNGVVAAVDEGEDFVPTPSVSRAIIRYNQIIDKTLQDAKGLEANNAAQYAGHLGNKGYADGIVITPSHNPPDQGGIKYNPTNGGPADTAVTKWIETRANEYIAKEGQGIKKISKAKADPHLRWAYDFKGQYVKELDGVINFEAIKKAKLKVLVNALGGSGANYWKAISETYDLGLTIINSEYDPTFSFMTYDHDGAIRMDCSSAYAMADVIAQIGSYDMAVGNDPDYDRYGIVTADGLIPPNHFLTVAGAYLFKTRPWEGKGFGKTAVVTNLVNRYCEAQGIPVYEVPVGFKYFSSLLFDETIGIGGEESAGASFLMKNGSVWTTDKDGIVMALLALEILAVTGKSPEAHYEELTHTYGAPVFKRFDAACSKESKEKLSALQASNVKATELGGEPIESIRTTSLYNDYPIGGVRVGTKSSFLVARPSGTEDLYKIYAESFNGEAAVEELLVEGQKLVDEAIS